MLLLLTLRYKNVRLLDTLSGTAFVLIVLQILQVFKSLRWVDTPPPGDITVRSASLGNENAVRGPRALFRGQYIKLMF